MSASALTALAGASLGRACLQGTLFILVVWGVCRVFPRLPDAARCGLWWLACLKLLLGLVWGSPVLLPLLPANSTHAGIFSRWPGKSFTATKVHSPTHLSHGAATVTQENTPEASATEVPEDATTVTDSKPAFAWSWLLPICIGLWAITICFRTGYLFRSLIVLRQCIARSRPLEDPALLLVAQEVSAEFGLSRMPGLCVSETVTDPLLCGLFRRVILFSHTDIANLSPEEFRLVFAHECAHLRRGDLWLSLVPALTQTLFYFFPPTWLACSEFEASREAACDTDALHRLKAAPDVYGTLLLKLSTRPERLDPLSLAGALGVSSHFRLLKRRITMLQYSAPLSRRRMLAGLCLVVLAGLCGLIPWQVVTAQTTINAKPAQHRSDTSMVNPGSGRNWTNAPTQPQNLDFTGGLDGWKKIEAIDEIPVDKGTPEYNIEIDPSGPRNGVPAASMTSVAKAPTRMALFDQSFRADAYRGKRLRFSALLKTDNVQGGADLWIREDTRSGQRAWNGMDNPLQGTTDWKRYEYVLDVLPNSQGLDFGVMLQGTGKVEAADFKFEVVDTKTPVSDPDYDSLLRAEPINLNFAKGLDGWNESTHDGDEAFFASGLDAQTKHNGVPAPYLACNSDKHGVYGVLTQWIDATPYRGKRIRFSGYIKTAGIRDYGGLMLTLNGPGDYDVYDMRKHPLKGDHDWTHVDYVADVPSDRTSFTLGINLQGRGTVWMDALKFEVVDKNVPLTPAFRNIHWEEGAQPQNLAFKQGMEHWSRTANGDNSPNPYYEVGVDRSVHHGDSPAGYLKASVPSPEGYGVLRQDIVANAFRGKRIRFSAYIKTKDIDEVSGLMIAVIGTNIHEIWSPEKNPVIGTTDWTRYDYVLDVPQEAGSFMFGVSIKGRGTIYATDFKFEVVGNDVPLSPAPSDIGSSQ